MTTSGISAMSATAADGAERHFDVVVVGGGAAGLSGALTLARARRSVLVIDGGEPRNRPAAHAHNYLTRDGAPPGDLLSEGAREVRGYGAEIRTVQVTAVERLDNGGFRIRQADGGDVLARRLLLACGVRDELPDLPGIDSRWGQDVLHCPYCHGWEVRDAAGVAVLGTGELAAHQALLWRQWNEHVTLIQHQAPDPDPDVQEALAARGIRTVASTATGLRLDSDGTLAGVETSGSRTADQQAGDGFVPCRALVVAPVSVPRAEPFAGLGLRPVEQRKGGAVIGTRIATDDTGATAVPGVWAAGNITDAAGQLAGSAAAGVTAAVAINADLVAEETEEAVAAYRTAAGYWDARYAGSEQMWSGEPNADLVREAATLPPGSALDLGCGEGADAVWLAGRGWRVTAVDISQVALDRGAQLAARSGPETAARISWARHDLAASFPEGSYTLVTTHFLHSPVELPRERILRQAATAVAPGGTLLIVGHTGHPGGTGPSPDHRDPDHRDPDRQAPEQAADHEHADHQGPASMPMPTSAEVWEALALPADEWELVSSTEHDRTVTTPAGERIHHTNTTLRLRRLPD